MFAYALRRVLVSIPMLLGVSVITFSILHLVPGDPSDILVGNDPAQGVAVRERIRTQLGLDRPMLEQYFRWLGGALTGDLGRSMLRNTPISTEIAQRLPVTIELALLAIVLTVLLGVPLGIVAAVRAGGLVDLLIRLVAFTSIASPSFLVGTILILGLSLYVPSIQTMGYVPFSESPLENLKLMLFPAVSLALVGAAVVARFTRTTLLETLNDDYVRTARAKGLATSVVVVRHAVRNALIPVVTVLGVQFGFLLGGTVVVEQVFALPGLGRLVVTAVNQRDYPMVQGCLLLLTTCFVVVNLLVDLLYPLLDPRVARG